MSRRICSIDKMLYEILTECSGRSFDLHELQVEYSSRSNESDRPPTLKLFWLIYMQINVLKQLRLVRKEGSLTEGNIFFLDEHFWDYPFNIVDQLFLD